MASILPSPTVETISGEDLAAACQEQPSCKVWGGERRVEYLSQCISEDERSDLLDRHLGERR